eukprot:gene224-202_t
MAEPAGGPEGGEGGEGPAPEVPMIQNGAVAGPPGGPAHQGVATVTGSNPALALHWSLGYNKDVVGGVHSLNGSELFYTAAHTGVIYDFNTGQQRLLQGHINPICAVCVSEDKQWIVTADSGEDSMLVVWDRHSGTPLKILFNGYKNGVHALDMTADSKYMVTLSTPEEGDPAEGEEANRQYLSVWDWTNSEADGPLCTALIGTPDPQTHVVFNQWDKHEIATNGKRRVFFWAWDANEAQPFQFYSPALSARDFRQRVGNFTQTIFLPESTQAATGTADGDVVIWDLSLIVDGLSRPDERRAVKILKLSPDVSLNVLKVHAPFVVVGGSDGSVRFYDYHFRVQAWFEDLSAGAVKSVSFDSESSEDHMEALEEFRCPNFLVATGSALVVSCQSDLFFKLEPSLRRGRLVLQGLDSPVHGLCCHPSEPIVAVSGLSGFLHLWDYQSRTLQAVKVFEKLVPSLLTYAKDGTLAVGFTTGQVKVLNGELAELASFRDAREAVTHLVFSEDCEHLAAGFADRHVALYTNDVRRSGSNVKKEWFHLAKHRSHWRPLVGLCFSQKCADLKLFSLGEDRTLVEYEVVPRASADDHGGLQMLSSTVVEQEARPTGLMWYPGAKSSSSDAAGDQDSRVLDTSVGASSEKAHSALQSPGDAFSIEFRIRFFRIRLFRRGVVVMNDEYKFKLFRNKACRSTTLAPTYGGPLAKMVPVFDESSEEQFLLYSTHEKVIGLIQMPLDGNPNKYMGRIAHPGPIAAVSVDYEGRFAFTAGGPDLTVNMWAIDAQPVATAALMGGSGVEPFLKLIEGGPESSFVSDLRDYFYYSQISSKGEQTVEARTLDGTIPLSEIPNLMCALGCFPTQQETQNMMNEVKYSRFEEQGEYTMRLVFDNFVKLYVNHRPVFSVGQNDLMQALSVLAKND